MNKFEKGSIIVGKVTGIEDYGIFVGLDDNYSGLVHISEISNGFVRNVGDYATVGEKIRVRIIEEKANSNHLKLSIKGISYCDNKNKKNHIEEVGNGFKPLKDNLERWIREYDND